MMKAVRLVLFFGACGAAVLSGCAEDEDGDPLAEGGDANLADDTEDYDSLRVDGLPNLTISSVSKASSCGSDGYCSVYFVVNVKNTGTATSYNNWAGAYWSSSVPVTSTCTGNWNARGSATGSVAPNGTIGVTVYGPGYVGAKVYKGSSLSVTFGADPMCNVAETSESDNKKTVKFTI